VNGTSRPARAPALGFRIDGRKEAGHAGLSPSRGARERAARGARRGDGDDRLAGDGALAFRDHHRRAFRQVDVEAGAEADHADPLAGGDAGALLLPADDAARHHAGDLHHDHLRPALDSMTSAFRSLSSLALSRSAERNFPGRIGDPLHATGDRRALMWQSNTFMKIETRGSRAAPSPSSAAARRARPARRVRRGD
jgi:hypothetical protein